MSPCLRTSAYVARHAYKPMSWPSLIFRRKDAQFVACWCSRVSNWDRRFRLSGFIAAIVIGLGMRCQYHSDFTKPLLCLSCRPGWRGKIVADEASSRRMRPCCEDALISAHASFHRAIAVEGDTAAKLPYDHRFGVMRSSRHHGIGPRVAERPPSMGFRAILSARPPAVFDHIASRRISHRQSGT